MPEASDRSPLVPAFEHTFFPTAILRTFKDKRVPMQRSLAGYWLIGMPAGALLGFALDFGLFGI